VTNILITGANGQVGQALQAFAKAHEIKVFSLSHLECDITCANQVEAIFSKVQPKFLINTAAFTAVDINAYALEHLAKTSAKYDCILLHLSTDYVFDGEKNVAYKETDVVHPLSIYGQSKYLGEQLIQQNLDKYLIFRVSWIFSEYGHNFLKTILRLAQEKKELQIVNDQRGCPTSASRVASMLFRVINQLKHGESSWGIYHYCDQPIVTWYEFAQQIIQEAKKIFPVQVEKILAITTVEFPTLAKRPQHSVLDCSKMMQVFHIQPSDWREQLARVIRGSQHGL
jgi:dTDP-4-dehydrorhamnose reductase